METIGSQMLLQIKATFPINPVAACLSVSPSANGFHFVFENKKDFYSCFGLQSDTGRSTLLSWGQADKCMN